MEQNRRQFLKQSAALGVLSVADIPSNTMRTQYDLIVVGAGTAGMPCAIAAAERGRRVLVVEKSDKAGGTLHLTGGHLSAGGTRHQRAHGIEDSIQAHYDDVMRISNGTAPADIVKLAVTQAPLTIDWLDSLGFEFAPESPRIVYGHVPYRVARTQYGKDAGVSIFKALKPLWDKYVTSGHIVFMPNTELKELVVEKKKVVGARVQQKSSESVVYYAKSVVLATGGYAANPTLFAQKHPNHPRLITTAAPTSTGEGIVIAEKAGAQFWNTDTHISSLGGIEFEPNTHHADFWQGWAMVFTTSYRPAREIYVNDHGKRFMDESNPDPDYRERAVAEQPQKRFWVIFDENALTGDTTTANVSTGYVNVDKTKTAAPMAIVPKWSVAQIKQYATEGKFLWAAPTIEALAQKTGLPVAELHATVTAYNGFVQNNIDAEFGRKDLKNSVSQAPFYALLTYATSLISFGGIKTNAQLQVLNHQNKPIANLYAAGEILGAGATTGNAFCGGMLVTPALSFGRLLGQRL
ncbi:MAG: FAD-dependent oxidoreductase [Spirosomaceae bacterium]|jgi:fumarate reductase flavoprotein subunit|nr:FAD-dependent oxidoreductase [Spirosomataceae bacterium]